MRVSGVCPWAHCPAVWTYGCEQFDFPQIIHPLSDCTLSLNFLSVFSIAVGVCEWLPLCPQQSCCAEFASMFFALCNMTFKVISTYMHSAYRMVSEDKRTFLCVLNEYFSSKVLPLNPTIYADNPLRYFHMRKLSCLSKWVTLADGSFPRFVFCFISQAGWCFQSAVCDPNIASLGGDFGLWCEFSLLLVFPEKKNILFFPYFVCFLHFWTKFSENFPRHASCNIHTLTKYCHKLWFQNSTKELIWKYAAWLIFLFFVVFEF